MPTFRTKRYLSSGKTLEQLVQRIIYQCPYASIRLDWYSATVTHAEKAQRFSAPTQHRFGTTRQTQQNMRFEMLWEGDYTAPRFKGDVRLEVAKERLLVYTYTERWHSASATCAVRPAKRVVSAHDERASVLLR